MDVFRSFDWLRIAPLAAGQPENRNWRLPLPIPGEAILRDGTLLRSELSGCVYNEGVGCLDGDRVSGALEVRNWRPGDQYQPLGHSGPQKIKALFQEGRIPIWERRDWPVVVSGDAILWTRRFGPDAAFAAGPGSRTALYFREVAEERF